MRRFERVHRSRLYRSRNGVLLGVCKGLADYFDFAVYWVRAILVICLIFSGFWPVIGLYFLAALIMKPEPTIPVMSEAEKGFDDGDVTSRRGAAERLKRRYENLERRLGRIEEAVTTREFDWDRRLNT